MSQNSLFKITQGLYVLSAKDDRNKRFAGSIVDAVMQAATTPVIIALSCMKTSYTGDCVRREGEFMLSIIPDDVDPLVIANFGFQTSKVVDKWANIDHEMVAGLPVLKDNLATIKAKVINTISFESHNLYLAEVVDDCDNRAARAITYQDYREGFKDKVFDAVKKAKEM